MRKLLIWDGDETLWKGTLLEGDEPELFPGRLALCEELSQRGVLQALASYNREEDALGVLHRFGLDRWFLHSQASLGGPTKGAMVTTIMAKYGLASPSAAAFVDDNQLNRAEVKTAYPDMTVGGPDDVEWMVERYFTKPTYTEEDRLRVRRYRDEQQREQAASAYKDNFKAFLQSCNITAEIRRAEPRDLSRIIDLARRANRMSTLVKAFTDQEFGDLVAQDHIVVVSVDDTFGSYGLSAFAIATPTTIDGIVVSCRLQGRGIGSALLGWVINTTVIGELRQAAWIENDYNGAMRGLYQWYGFRLRKLGDYVTADLVVNHHVDLPDWIEIR